MVHMVQRLFTWRHDAKWDRCHCECSQSHLQINCLKCVTNSDLQYSAPTAQEWLTVGHVLVVYRYLLAMNPVISYIILYQQIRVMSAVLNHLHDDCRWFKAASLNVLPFMNLWILFVRDDWAKIQLLSAAPKQVDSSTTNSNKYNNLTFQCTVIRVFFLHILCI